MTRSSSNAHTHKLPRRWSGHLGSGEEAEDNKDATSCHLRELPWLQTHGASGAPPSSPWKAAAPHVHYQPCFKTEVTISLENESLKLVSHAWSWLHLGGIYTKKRERNLCGFTSAAGACFYFLLGLPAFTPTMNKKPPIIFLRNVSFVLNQQPVLFPLECIFI